MAALVLGAGLGAVFGPVGWLAGSLIGNLLSKGNDPGPGPAPKIQGSNYGAMIPIPYGTIRIWSPQVVWEDVWQSHKHTQGKGGGGVPYYTWSTSWALKVCKAKLGGVPIDGVLRIWANGTLVYDVTSTSTTDNSQCPVTIYLGDETSNPDPTMEAALGVGNVPAFRDDVALVFSNWDCGNFGNTLPQISVEIFVSGDVMPIPWRVNYIPNPTSTQWWNSSVSAGITGASYDGANKVTAYRYANLLAVTYAANYWVDCFETGVSPQPDPDRPGVGTTPLPNITGGGGAPRIAGGGGVCTNFPAAYCYGASDSSKAAWFVDQRLGTVLEDNPDGSGGGPDGTPVFNSVCADAIYINGAIYGPYANTSSGWTGIAKWQIGGSWSTYIRLNGTIIPGVSATAYKLGTGDDGNLWLAYADSSPGTHGDGLIKISPRLDVLYHWDQSDPAHTTPSGFTVTHQFVVYKNLIASSEGLNPSANFTVWDVDPTTFAITLHGSIPQYESFSISMFRGFVLVADGIVSLDSSSAGGPTILSSIVEDISLRAGLISSEFDVSALTDLVDGYLITQQQAGRNDIEPLRSCYFFDAVERSGQSVFVKRGATPTVTIPDDELAAQEPNQEQPPLVKIERVQEVDLPSTVNMRYLNSGAAFQPGNQIATMQTRFSDSQSTIDVQVAMSDEKARQVAFTLLRSAWVERMKATFWTSRKYDYLEPTDVVTVHGYVVRITKKTERVVGIVEFEGLLNIPSLYATAPTGTPTSGGGQPVAPTAQPTDLLLFNVAMITDLDYQNGFYAAMAGTVDNTWTGARLFQSTDSGTTFDSVAQQTVASTIAACSTTLPDFEGGNIFDECSTLTVVVGVGGGELVNATQDAVLNGANYGLVGDPTTGIYEILQYKNAPLTATSTYELSGFLRGRRGTEWAIPLHVAGEIFVALPITDVDLPFSELGLPFIYKPVSLGGTLAGTIPSTFTDTGEGLRPYSPVDVTGAPITPFDGRVQVAWTRRTRIGGAWLNFTDVPLSEPNETYVVQFWDSTFAICARTVVVASNNTYTYANADQVTDYGQQQKHIYVSVGQLGAYTLGRQTTATLPGLGASDTSPVSPVIPYNGFLPNQ